MNDDMNLNNLFTAIVLEAYQLQLNEWLAARHMTGYDRAEIVLAFILPENVGDALVA